MNDHKKRSPGSMLNRGFSEPQNAQCALALPLGELSRVSVTERVLEYLQGKYSIFPDFHRKSGALSDLASLGHLSQRERQVAFFDKLRSPGSVWNRGFCLRREG